MFWAGKMMSKLMSLPERMKKADRDLDRIRNPKIDDEFNPEAILKEFNEEITEKRVKLMKEVFNEIPIVVRRTKKPTIFNSKANANWGNALSREALHAKKISVVKSVTTGKVVKTLWLIWTDEV